MTAVGFEMKKPVLAIEGPCRSPVFNVPSRIIASNCATMSSDNLRWRT